VEIAVPDGIIAHLTRACQGNVHDRGVVAVTAGSLATPARSKSEDVPKKVADLDSDSYFASERCKKENEKPSGILSGIPPSFSINDGGSSERTDIQLGRL
jgi:hypothetical protein